MGCVCCKNPEAINRDLREAIKTLNFPEIYKNLVISNRRMLDQSLIHEAVKSGQIDMIDAFVDYRRMK